MIRINLKNIDVVNDGTDNQGVPHGVDVTAVFIANHVQRCLNAIHRRNEASQLKSKTVPY